MIILAMLPKSLKILANPFIFGGIQIKLILKGLTAGGPLQIYLQTLNVKMTAVVLNQSFNKIKVLASKLSGSFTPFFFVKQNAHASALQQPKLTIKINREMSPFFCNLPSSTRLGFWNIAQFEPINMEWSGFEKSIILNPFKTQKLIRSAFKKGIKKMIVSDVDQLVKIQESYFKLQKEGIQVSEPEYIWAIQNSTCDLQNILDVQKCSLPVNGFYFSNQMGLQEVQNFLQNQNFAQGKFENFREVSKENLRKENEFLNHYDIEPMVTNYSETNDYLMVCRVIGKDKNGSPIFDNSCTDFICKLDTCACSAPSTKKVDFMFEAGGSEWAAVTPARLDRLQTEHIKG